MSFSQFTSQDFELIAQEWSGLKEAARKRCANEEEFQVVLKAFDFANEAHKNVRRRSGEPYIIHPIAVAKIVVGDIGLGYKSIVSALLHDVVEDTKYTSDDIRNLFGEKIASLVEGLTKIKTVLDNDAKSKNEASEQSDQAENFKRILLTLNDDVRVILIKLADRLHNCRTIEFMPEYKRDKILSETMFIFIPLAHRLGLYEIKSEMENIWLRYKEPGAYSEISAKISKDSSAREKEISDFSSKLHEALQEHGFNFVIRKRVKTPYSTWHKMQTKNIPFEQVYDHYAIRIIFTPDPDSKETERDQCYHVFSIITGIYRYKPDRVRDWVKHPKSNGYEALHCTLMTEKGLWVEVQIRTQRMDDIAERGIAAHWAYKKDGYIGENDSEMDKWLVKVKEILVSPDVNALELLDIIHNDLTAGEIVVFTPKGDQKSIRKGATALDFAYQIHTEIGNKAIAAKINQKLTPISQVLRTGDLVEIITAEDEHPKKDWLTFLQTPYAINKVLEYFRSKRRETSAVGRKILDEKIKALGKVLDNDLLQKLLRKFGFSKGDSEEFCFRLGLGTFDVNQIDSVFKQRDVTYNPRSPWPSHVVSTEFRGTPVVNKNERFLIGDPTRKYIFATCCNPIPGDPIVGVLSPDGTVTVHMKTCKVAESIASKHGDWLVSPEWGESVDSEAFVARIVMHGIDRLGLLNQITSYISKERAFNIKRISASVEKGIFEGFIDMNVTDRHALGNILTKLRSLDGITNVERAEI